MLDNRYSLLFIRGERPIKDKKFDLLRHPNIKLTADGGAKPYSHGDTGLAKLTIKKLAPTNEAPEPSKPSQHIDVSRYIVLSEEDVEEAVEKTRRKTL